MFWKTKDTSLCNSHLPSKSHDFTAHAGQVFFGLSNLTANSYFLSTLLHVDIKLRIFSKTSAAEGREKLPINVY